MDPQDLASDAARIQTALDQIASGETLCFGVGVFHVSRAVTFRGRNVTLRGADPLRPPTLDFYRQRGTDPGLLLDGVSSVRVSDLTVVNARGAAIEVRGGESVAVRSIRAVWTRAPDSPNGRYGLAVHRSNNVLLEGSIATGATDAAYRVADSTRVIVRDNDGGGATAGVAVLNSNSVEVYRNRLRGNAVGVLVADLPNRMPANGRQIRIRDNLAERNNATNRAVDPAIAVLPAGVGVLVLAANEVEIDHNTFRGHTGPAALVDSHPTAETAAYDPYAESVFLHENVYVDNGAAPVGQFREIANNLGVRALESVLWDGVRNPAWGTEQRTLCLVEAPGVSFRNLGVSAGALDRMPHLCTFPPVGVVRLPFPAGP